MLKHGYLLPLSCLTPGGSVWNSAGQGDILPIRHGSRETFRVRLKYKNQTRGGDEERRDLKLEKVETFGQHVEEFSWLYRKKDSQTKKNWGQTVVPIGRFNHQPLRWGAREFPILPCRIASEKACNHAAVIFHSNMFSAWFLNVPYLTGANSERVKINQSGLAWIQRREKKCKTLIREFATPHVKQNKFSLLLNEIYSFTQPFQTECTCQWRETVRKVCAMRMD